MAQESPKVAKRRRVELPNDREREGAVQVLGITLSVATAPRSMPGACERNMRLNKG